MGADLAGAYCHLAVAQKELGNCLAPALEEDEVLVLVAMLFGFKAAPLIMGRLSAALARLWQSMLMKDGELQIYMDDPLFVLVGPKTRRRALIAVILYTASAMGINVAYHKGNRGLRLTWIGIQMEVNVTMEIFTLSIPEKMAAELGEKIRAWKNKGMVGFRELRATTGRLSWIAGIVPRVRWAVTVLYAVVTSAEADALSGAEARRAQGRADSRAKDWLVPVKRFELARGWLEDLFAKPDRWLLREELLVESEPQFLVMADASPLGLGVILAAANVQQGIFEPIAAVKTKVTAEDAEFLGVAHGQAESQGPLEAAALALGLWVWADKIRGAAILMRSDSVVALAVARKLTGSSPALNFMGAALSSLLEKAQVPKLTTHHVPGVLNVEATGCLGQTSKRRWQSRKRLRV